MPKILRTFHAGGLTQAAILQCMYFKLFTLTSKDQEQETSETQA